MFKYFGEKINYISSFTAPETYDTLESSDFEEAKSNRASRLFSKENFKTLKNYVEETEKNCRIIAVLANVCFMSGCLASLILELQNLNFSASLINILFILIGFICLICEYEFKLLPYYFSKYPLLYHGRSIVYILMGVVLFTQGSLFQILLGIGILLVGLFIFYHMRRVEVALSHMKLNVLNEQQLKVMFDDCDKDKKGYLNSSEIAWISLKLESFLYFNETEELESAICTLKERSNAKEVSFQNFKDWYYSNSLLF